MARDDLLLPALLLASRADGAIRLVEPGDSRSGTGLFPTTLGDYAALIREAVPQLLQVDPRAPNQPRQVRLTELGMEVLLNGAAAGERAALVEGASPLYQKALYAKWTILIHRHGWKADRTAWAQCGARLAKDYLDGEGEEETSGPAAGGSALSGDDGDFKRALAQELVMSWKHADHPGAREGIARAMRSVGVRQLGEPGETVTFEGRYHVSESPLFPGDPGVVRQPGWLIHDGKGEYLLEKAVLEPR